MSLLVVMRWCIPDTVKSDRALETLSLKVNVHRPVSGKKPTWKYENEIMEIHPRIF